MESLRVRTFRDLMAGHPTAEITCLLKQTVMVRLRHTDDRQVEVEAIGAAITVPLDTPITYQPWFMDRGSLLFDNPHEASSLPPRLKIATEGDILSFPNGRRYSLAPDLGAVDEFLLKGTGPLAPL